MPKFFYADRTLGKLVKWLRILGFDTVSELDHKRAVNNCRQIDRIQLTRKKAIGQQNQPGQWVTIESDHVMEQLRQLVQAVSITYNDIDLFSRCLICNTLLEPVDKVSVRQLVPDYVWETITVFNRCGSCEKIYWPGSHHSRVIETVQDVFGAGKY